MEPLEPAGDGAVGKGRPAAATGGGSGGAGEPKALACYGLWLPQTEQTWLRFVDGRPVSALTVRFLDWCAEQAAPEEGLCRLVLFWDNANWHTSRLVREAVRTHNQQVQRRGQGVLLRPIRCRARVPGSTRSSRSGCMPSGALSNPSGCS